MTNKYKEMKGKIRGEAKEWQNNFANNNYSYYDLAFFTDYFTKMGKRYGLLKEFHENGICQGKPSLS